MIPLTRTSPARRRLAVLGLAAVAVLGGSLAGCTPTIRLQVDPIQIYAKLDIDARVKLDQELQTLLRENPNLF